MKRAQKKLNDQEVQRILAEAKKESRFDYLALKTLIALDLRRAELVGQNDTKGRMVVKLDVKGEEWYFQTKSHENPGMLIEKLTDKGIWLRRKKHEEDTFCPIPPALLTEIHELIKDRRCDVCGIVWQHHPFLKCENPMFGPIFPRTTGWVWYRVQHYAVKAGITDAKMIHPHSLRHWATRRTALKYGVIRARDHAGHANISTTNTYIAQSDDKDIEEASQMLLEKLEIV